MSRPRVWSAPPDLPLIDCFVDCFLSGAVIGRAHPLSPEEVARALVFVPTRRAAEALTAAFAASAGGAARLLPRVTPLGDEDAFDEAGAWLDGAAALLPAISDLDRKLQLFQLVDKWREVVAASRLSAGEAGPFHVAASRADAFALAGDLARLIDETIIEDVPLARLAGAMPEAYEPARHDAYWSMTARFLQIAASAWPEFLEKHAILDPSERVKRGLRALSAALSAKNPLSPVVVLGSTGSVAATADLMAAVARLPAGAVILPGLDLDLDAASWARIGAEGADLSTRFGHPQALLKRTLARIGIARDEVLRLPPGAGITPRQHLLSELFRPAETTARWRRTDEARATLDAALEGVSLIEAGDAAEEALAIALALRETVETPGATAALVTPDRQLARAVQTELDRWDVTVADSAGEPLSATPLAVLARLLLVAAEPEAGAVDLLALLRHPLVSLGLAGAERTAAIDAIEIAVLRGQRLRGGAEGLAAAAARARDAPPDARAPLPRRRIPQAALADAAGLAARLAQALTRFAGLWRAPVSLRQAAAAHRILLTTLLAGEDGEPVGWTGEAGRALSRLYDSIAAAGDEGPTLDLADYRSIFDQMAGEAVVRSPRPAHPRIKIWGLLEARMLSADRIILGGLDEGIWPPEAKSDPFLNRPMRLALGLAPPERRIGQSAHDILMLMGGREVILTRAAKRGGAPAIASRFLRRLMAYAGAERSKVLKARGEPYLRYARLIDRPYSVAAAPRPEPKVPPALMPPRLSLTEVETLYRDPYAVFARRVLALDVLDPIDPPLDARDRGTVIHDVLAAYVRNQAPDIGPAAETALLALGRDAFATLAADDPEAVEFWWRRFAAFVPWFVRWDAARRQASGAVLVETDGALALDLAHGQRLTLSTRADRMEQRSDGRLAILDYKTGAPPGVNEVLSGLNPQLTLTAALAARGAFRALPARAAEGGVELGYLRVAGPRGVGEARTIVSKKEPLEEVIERQFAALVSHLNEYLNGLRGFVSHRRPKKRAYRSDYDHLARHLEWSLGGEAEGDEP